MTTIITGGKMSAVKLNFALHEAQQEIYNHPARFKVAACGRRFGKTWLALIMCIVEGLREKGRYGDPIPSHSEVVYIGVTLEQARRNAWKMLKTLAGPVIGVDKTGRKLIHENNSTVQLVNGVTIRLLGMDTPDAARGMDLRFAVLDEYAQMPEEVFPEIIRPALMVSGGGSLFIGTPKGRNHFFEIFYSAMKGELGDEWKAFNFSSARNTCIRPEELASTIEDITRGSSFLRKQEIDANFLEPSGDILKPGNFIRHDEEPRDGEWKITVDLAGFVKSGTSGRDLKVKDYHAIAITKVYPVDQSASSRYMAYGWWIKDIQYGKWDVRTTAQKIVQALRDHPGAELGIEQGAYKDHIEGYLEQYAHEYSVPLQVTELKHRNNNKQDRIRWALDGRSSKGRILYASGEWNEEFLDEVGNFPSPRVHDDLIDAVAYVDQLSESTHYDIEYVNSICAEPLDVISGY
jgi:hypothetical protein